MQIRRQREVERRDDPRVHCAKARSAQCFFARSAQQRLERRAFDQAILLQPRKLARLADVPPHSPRDDADDAAEHEREAPTPRDHCLFAKRKRERRGDGLTEQHARVDASHQRRGGEALLAIARMFCEPAQRCRQLAAERHALQQSQQHEQHRRRVADRLVARQQRDRHRRERHADHRVREHVRAPFAIGDVCPQQPADRTREVANGKHEEGLQRLRGLAGLGRKERGADLRREHRKDHEVIELKHAAERGDQRRAQQRAS